MTKKLLEESLTSLYLRIEYGDTPSVVPGVDTTATEAEIRDAYRVFALKIHPDKAPEDRFRDLHTFLFQKVQASYDALLKEKSAGSSATSFDSPRQLPETLTALHARNVAFKEALQKERSRATDVKKVKDAKADKLRSRHQQPAGTRDARTQVDELVRAKWEEKLTKETMSNSDSSECSKASDWEQEEDRLEKKDKVAARLKKKFQAPPQNKPTASSSTSITEPGLDTRLASTTEINGRWDQSLLQSGTSGPVSLKKKAQKENNVAATTHKHLMALVNEADAVYHRPEDQHLRQDALEEAFVQIEDEVDVMAEEDLRMIDQDVREQHLLDQGGLELGATLVSLSIKWKEK